MGICGFDLEAFHEAAKLSGSLLQFWAAFWVSAAPREVLSAACAMPWMLLVISALPCAASPTLRTISLVVAFCSSTALAMVLEIWLI